MRHAAAVRYLALALALHASFAFSHHPSAGLPMPTSAHVGQILSRSKRNPESPYLKSGVSRCDARRLPTDNSAQAPADTRPEGWRHLQ
jgi:hypothetical protein